MKTLCDTIRDITRRHLLNGNYIVGQCLTAVGWVQNTVPNDEEIKDRIVELPITDVAGADIVCGMAIANTRPILVIRFQDFLMLNGNAIVNFAAKRKEIFQRSCPIFIRAIGREGNGTGNSHSGKLHSIFCHFPGLRVYVPITSSEYARCYNEYMGNDDPVLVCEHAKTFDNQFEFDDELTGESDITLIGISYARLNMMEYISNQEEYTIDSFHVSRLIPYDHYLIGNIIESLKQTGLGLIIDTGFEVCSYAKDLAHQLMLSCDAKVYVLGLDQVNVGCRKENLTPSTKMISNFVWNLVEK